MLDPLAEQVKLTPMIGILQPALCGTALWVLLLTGCSPSSDDISVLGGAEDRFAPGRGIEDSELSNYWVQFEVEGRMDSDS